MYGHNGLQYTILASYDILAHLKEVKQREVELGCDWLKTSF